MHRRRASPTAVRVQQSGSAEYVSIIVAAGACLLAITACGSSSSRRMPPQGASNLRSQGIEYADCMRSHGVPKYPDPTTTGRISRVNLNTPGLNPSSALFQAAESTCSKLLPKGAPGEQQSSDVSERAGLLAISRCMRRHGVSGFPDPTTGSPPSNPSGEVAAGGGVFMAVPSTIDTNSPAFKQAATACRFGPHPLH